MKFLFSALLVSICFTSVLAQYLPPRFQGKTVSMKLVHDGKYVAGHDAIAAGNRVYQLYELPDFYSQEWTLQTGTTNDWYLIYHVASQRYLTVNTGTGKIELQNRMTGGQDALYQNFQFVAETQTDRFKIHTRFSNAGLDYILQIANSDVNDGTDLTFGPNITIGNSENQKFDLTDLYPPVNPGSAIPSLADRFKGRTVGFIDKYYNQPLQGNATSGDINMTTIAAYPVFNKEFKIEYTNETGWFKIKHKPSGKYVTVMSPIVDGGVVKLQTDGAYPDDQQKFKFIIQANDSTYKIHSKYSVGAAGFEKALVLEFNSSGVPMRLKKNIVIGTDTWQQFIITMYLNPPAEFTSGAPMINGGKILEKQYYISNYESLALLEPYIVGVDTFVRVQNSPVYGTQSEWTFDDGGFVNSLKTVRIRYGKTGQYVYIPVADSNTNPTPGMLLKLKKDTGGVADRRYKFYAIGDGSAQHPSYLRMMVGGNNTTNYCQVNDDGLLSMYDPSSGNTYVKNQKFIVNLSMPLIDTFAYAITSKDKGHLVSDSGIDLDNTKLVHSESATQATLWNFIPAGIGYYRIKNALTQNYIMAAYGNGGGVGTEIHTTIYNGSSDMYLWALERNDNYYRIKNKSTGKYFALYNHPDPGNPIYNGLVTDPGTDWAVTRADYITDPLFDSLSAETMLSNYSPSLNNVFNQDSIKDKLMKNIGLPFQPSYVYPHENTFTIQQNFQLTQIPYSPAPDFYQVVRSALSWKFGWSTAQVDSAMKNYKFTKPGHRIQVVYALREYILENLALRSDRSTWTYNERELVAYLERTIKKMKEGYANRLSNSWNAFISETASNSTVYFDALMGFIPDPNYYTEPEYYIPNPSQTLSLIEYSAICKTYNYKNPNVLASLIAPTLSVPGATVATSLTLNLTNISQYASNIKNIAQDAFEAIIKISRVASTTMVQDLADASSALNIIRVLSSVEGASGTATIVMMLLQGIIQYGQEGTAYEKFNDAILDKEQRLLNTPIDINMTMQGSNSLNKFYMCQDFDYVLATGKRFDDDGIPNVTTFNGNGNWSNPANWNSNSVPPNPLLSLDPGIATPDSIIVNPLPGGQCLLDINLDASALGQKQVPIMVMPGKTFKIATGVTLKIKDLKINH